MVGGLGFIGDYLGLDQLRDFCFEHTETLAQKKKRKIIKHREEEITLVVGKDINLDGIMELDVKKMIKKFLGHKVSHDSLEAWILEQCSPLFDYSPFFHTLNKGC
jgi:hypothetical protein